MCLIFTFLAAVCTSIICFSHPQFIQQFQLHKLALMYWGATLMWSIDGVFQLREGEAFFDLSLNDAFLGIVVIVCGVVLWGLITFAHRRKTA